MKLATLTKNGTEEVCVVTPAGYFPVSLINEHFNRTWPADLLALMVCGGLDEMKLWYAAEGRSELRELADQAIPADRVVPAALYRHPSKIWGIGLNYAAHASDLSEKAPTGIPASFMKPDTTIIGFGEPIKIPLLSHKTTAEAELGILIGKKCKHVEPHEWLQVVAGFTPIIDMTAEDILRRNPRYLTLSKSFDTFFSFGPHLVTPDEIEDVMQLTVATVVNDKVHAQNKVANMTFPPDLLVSFHSQVMTLLPGDIISSGTPGAVEVKAGDVAGCRISGFEPLENPVMDLKAG